MNDFLLAALTISIVILFAVLVYPALMAFAERVLDRLFGEREDKSP